MKKPKKSKPSKPKSLPPPRPPAPPPIPDRWWKRFGNYIFGALVLVASVVGVILFADWARDQYAKTTPEIAPKESEASSRNPPAFVVKNISPYAMGGEVRLVCGIDSAMFDLNGKMVGFSIPVTSDMPNPPIQPGQTAEYRCDPSVYMKVENGGISSMGLFAKMPDIAGAELRLVKAVVRVGVKYRILGFPRESLSESWKLERNHTFKWTEMRPVYK
jgi:hypothetical protein